MTPEALSDTRFKWNGTTEDKQRVIDDVHKYWDTLEKQLNKWFTLDVGIVFHIVRNNKLIIFQNGQVPVRNKNGELNSNKKIIDDAVGEDKDKYDVSVLIVRPHGRQTGLAFLGSAISPYIKGQAWSIYDAETVAHKLGHTFGADHTHQRLDSNCTEPGIGTSIMSYGYQRDFFSLASIKEMRGLLANFNYYTDDTRSQDKACFVNSSETVMPYAVETTTQAPELDREKIKQEYTITKGTNFQFYLPLKNTTDSDCYYNVNPFDFTSQNYPNPLKPAYKSIKSNCIMFQPYYKDPEVLSEQEKETNSLTTRTIPTIREQESTLSQALLTAMPHTMG